MNLIPSLLFTILLTFCFCSIPEEMGSPGGILVSSPSAAERRHRIPSRNMERTYLDNRSRRRPRNRVKISSLVRTTDKGIRSVLSFLMTNILWHTWAALSKSRQYKTYPGDNSDNMKVVVDYTLEKRYTLSDEYGHVQCSKVRNRTRKMKHSLRVSPMSWEPPISYMTTLK